MPVGPGGPLVSRARPSRLKNCGVRPQFYAARARPCAAGNARKFSLPGSGISAFFCLLYSSSEWYDQLGGTANPLTDSIFGRIILKANTLDVLGSLSNKDISI